MGSDSKFLTTAKTVSFLIRTEENSAFWTVFHTLIIKAAIMCSNSHSFTQISTGSHIRRSAKLAVMIDKRQPALHREGGSGGSGYMPNLYHTESFQIVGNIARQEIHGHRYGTG